MNHEPSPALPARRTVLGETAWLLSGFVLPLARPAYYRQANQRATRVSVAFYLLLSSLLALLFTAAMVRGLSSARSEIEAAFARGNFPEITIQNGVASVKGPNPAVLVDHPNQFIAIDTTGRYQRIDNTVYSEGLLLTRSDIHLLQHGRGYRTLPLSDLHAAFSQNPILINQQTVLRLLDTISTILTLGGFIFLVIWYMVVRLVYILILAGIINLLLPVFGQKPDFHTVLVTGIYALIPALSLHYLLTRIGTEFFAMQTLCLLLFWGLGLFWTLRDAPVPTLQLWHALLGLPLLAMISLDVIFRFPSGGLLVWAFAAATLLVLVGVQWMSQNSTPGEGQPGVPE